MPAANDAMRNTSSIMNGYTATTTSLAASQFGRVTGRNKMVGRVPLAISVPSSSAAEMATRSGRRNCMDDSSDSAGTWKPDTR